MIEFLDSLINWYNNYIGGYLIVAILVPTGIFFTLRFKFLQITKIGHTINIIRGKYDKKGAKGDVNHFKALTTALSATVGTGNIVGVSLAIYFGGPGAVFWMWVTAFFGMMLKLVENTLAIKFRITNSDGTVSGGPMYYIESLKPKLGKIAKIMAVIFAIAAILCSLGTGNMAQSNSISDALLTTYNIPTLYTAIALSLLLLIIVVGGIKRIAEVTSKLVPIMAVFYFISAIIVLFVFRENIIPSIKLIFVDAFTGTAATGGFIGAGFMIALMKGVQRGLFSNEAGQGSSPMAHAAAKTEYPLREGLVASIEPLIDTLVICTLTALVIISSGAWTTGLKGVAMTINGFENGFAIIGMSGFAKHIITIGLLLFAFSTIISWSYYGTRAVQYVFGEKFIKPYYYFYAIFVLLGAIGKIDIVWNFVDMVITFMTIPNLIALLILTPVMKKEIDKYLNHIQSLKKK